MKTRRLAWHGVALTVPANWEIANYSFPGRGVARLDVEDEYALRLELDWLEAPRRAHAARFLDENDAAADNLKRKADQAIPLTGLPEGWRGTRYEFREAVPTRRQKRELAIVAHSLLSALYISRDATFICRLRLHFLPGDKEEPETLLRQVAASLERHNSGPVPWELFDIAFETPREFLLESTTFDIGSKLLVFRWGGRRLYLWFLSCADRFLSSAKPVEEWVTGFLNGLRRVPGIVFWPGAAGALTWRRRHLLCHRDELSRWCFQYQVGYRRDLEHNQLRIWVFNYRRREDLRCLPPDLVAGATHE
jgi:hypothetical protein